MFRESGGHVRLRTAKVVGKHLQALGATLDSVKCPVSCAEIYQLPGRMEDKFVDSLATLEQLLSNRTRRKSPVVQKAVNANVIQTFRFAVSGWPEEKLDQPPLRNEHPLKNNE